MGGGQLSDTNPVIVGAFRTALRHEALIVAGLLIISFLAWATVTVLGGRRAGSEGRRAAPEPAGRRVLRAGFGVLWILDGVLQAQQSMPIGLPSQVVQPAASGSPAWVGRIVGDGLSIWERHPIPAATSAVWIQIGLGVLLLIAPRGWPSRLAGAAGLGWGLVVWVFGEAFGGIFGSGVTWLFGAPGAVLFYCAGGLLVALPERLWSDRRMGRSVLAVMGWFFVTMAVVQAWPGRGFWQGQDGRHGASGIVAAMVRTMAAAPQPAFLHSWLLAFSSFDARHGWGVNLFVVVSLAAIGAALSVGGRRLVTVAVVAASALCLAAWVLVQDLGFLGGVGTDPNSMVPVVVLILGGYVAMSRPPPLAERRAPPTMGIQQPSGAPRDSSPSDGRPGDVAGLVPAGAGGAPTYRSVAAASGVVATVCALGVLLVGAVPMAAASVRPGTDAIVSEGVNGQPQYTDTPAPVFDLVDQRGRPVSLADLRGRTVALTFLDPVCTSDCPLIAQEMRSVDDSFGSPGSRRTAFVAVVANPVYRSPAFTLAFDRQENLQGLKNWYFLTGSLAQLQRVWDNYGIEVQALGGGAMVAHDDTAFVIDATGRLREVVGADPGDDSTTASSFASLLGDGMRTAMRA
jgi:cytochrome oxidase Cu insertion factor (SCO1/SenC/PrrC family)